ncbi:uncharacterized integral membrane protein [Methylophaga frappieri]|jgi:uncharacterized integral membrane protein|uniref:Uncharacterized integral membrane protein n=1 Tax=Methylophaga frappieri (strain ATCC BAA-2434 / DSM 25690 / JAM7) TaxID=754477 RepID=I1YFU1_METFJ|nr:LapA family protein [Methylophaga frappieri]AFJ01784.1 uncharacterized integral membrane protein [Methylophaga frappieri]
MVRKVFLLSLFALFFIITVIFAAFNTNAVAIDFYFVQWQLPLAVIIIIALLCGLLCGALLITISTLKVRLENRQLQHKLQIAEQELNSLRILPVRDNH